ncbi:uncharacterized protein C11orf97 homolog isoform X1 [Anas platyrhynchos]|uniref:uncharacterized protein C11orf97 homolog isoform X1 n=1 Tax=Anas platyrhynchos TaxID=8839 RepID=UPI000F7C16C7|eukprot:XP_021123405.2 uncharacterized protein C11orf97 homolog isoform X1 [Anas platyrhynchos]
MAAARRRAARSRRGKPRRRAAIAAARRREAGSPVSAAAPGSPHCPLSASGSPPRLSGHHGGKKFVYVEPSRRVKEILQEELYFQKEEYSIKHPAAVSLEGIWSLKKNFSIGGLKPASQNRNGLLLQPQFYSRHAAMRK